MAEKETTNLGDIDVAQVEQYWQRFVAANDVEAGAPDADVFQFGDSAEVADRLLALVVEGPKRATASRRLEHADDGSDLPRVDDRFAWDEGEGDRTRDDWLRIHIGCFGRARPIEWEAPGDDLPVVFERFELVCQEPGTAR